MLNEKILVKKDHILYASTKMKHPKEAHLETESRLAVAYSWGKGKNGEWLLLKGISFGGDKSVLNLNYAYGYTTLWLY